MMECEDILYALKGLLNERQNLSHPLNYRAGLGFPLEDHGSGRLDRNHSAERGFVVSCTDANVYDSMSIARGRQNQPLDTGLRLAESRVGLASALVKRVAVTR